MDGFPDVSDEGQRNLEEINVLTGRSYEATKKVYRRGLTSLAKALEDLRGESRG